MALSAKEKRELKAQQAAEKEAGARAQAEKDAAATAAGRPTSEQIAELNKQTILHPDQVPSAHGEIMQKETSVGGIVFVGCKIGVQAIQLQLSELVDVTEQTQTGSRTIKQPRRFGPAVRIRGTAYPRGTPPDGFPEKPMIVHGCAVNPNVDREFMIAWMKLHANDPMVLNNMIFFAEDLASLTAKAAEHAGIISGFEPLNPKNDPRKPRSTNPAVEQIETEEERAKKMRAAHA